MASGQIDDDKAVCSLREECVACARDDEGADSVFDAATLTLYLELQITDTR
jgi:hypothetical protein